MQLLKKKLYFGIDVVLQLKYRWLLKDYSLILSPPFWRPGQWKAIKIKKIVTETRIITCDEMLTKLVDHDEEEKRKQNEKEKSKQDTLDKKGWLIKWKKLREFKKMRNRKNE